MNNNQTRRAAAFVCATVATLAMLVGTDMMATHKNSNAIIAANQPATAAAQVVVVTGQRAPRI
jgi:hypothetical protein